MCKRGRMIVALVAALAAVAVVVVTMTGPATALDGQAVTFEVNWQPREDMDGERHCHRRPFTDEASRGDRPAHVEGFTEVVAIRNAGGEIVHMAALDGELVEDDDGVLAYCSVVIDAALELSAGHTVWYEQTYLASIPPEGLSGELNLIILTD